jgi:hypothetical protein
MNYKSNYQIRIESRIINLIPQTIDIYKQYISKATEGNWEEAEICKLTAEELDAELNVLCLIKECLCD